MLPRVSHINHLPRYKEVFSILVKHGFGPMFDRFPVRRLWRKASAEDITYRASWAKRLRHAFEELGPTYVKLGQLLSTRPDILAPEYIKELEKLQNDVPPFPFEDVIEICVSEGIKLDEAFSFINPTPIAAASIAQVHEARLVSGQEVVIKVQRPGIKKTVDLDLEILKELSIMLEKRSRWGSMYKVSEVVDEVGEALRNELDFRKEARNADKFYHNFKNSDNVVIPRVFWEFTSERVLTLEFIEGIKISDLVRLKKENFNTQHIADHLVEALFQQVYEDGFFHADLHPGNVAITQDEKIIFYDFGQVGVVDQFIKEKGMNLLVGMMQYDTDTVSRALLDIAIGHQNINRESLKMDVSRLQQKYYGLPLSEIHVGEALAELIEVSVKYQMRLPPQLSLLVKMLMTVESMISQLDPQLSIVDIAEPYGKKIMVNRFSARRLKNQLEELLLDYSGLAKSFPREMLSILKLIEQGELRIKLEHSNLRKLTARVDVLSNRLSLAIILASIIIGSSLIVNSSSRILSRIPLVEVGFITAMVLGLFLVYSIIRSGRY